MIIPRFVLLLCFVLFGCFSAKAYKFPVLKNDDEASEPKKITFDGEQKVVGLEDETDMVDIDYGYPVDTGGLIVEYPFFTTDPPGLWDPVENPWGSFGLIQHLPEGRKDEDCPPIPAGSPLEESADVLKPKSIFKTHGMNACMLTCNLTAVKENPDNDPCRVGSIKTPSFNYMTCYDLGESWFGDASLGACGYNCTALSGASSATPCTQDDIDTGNCFIFCDSSLFPGA
jgi:hypothetical protein